MVAINDLHKNTNRMNRSRSKQFTVILLSLGMMMLVWLNSARPSTDIIGTKSTPKPMGGSMGNDHQRLTSNTEYDNLNENENLKTPEKKIRQISLIGERNSGTRWSWE